MTDAPAPETHATPTAAAPSAAAKKPVLGTNPYFWGTGRRKTAVARVRIKPGSGLFKVNDRDVDEFFKVGENRQAVRTPLNVTETIKSMDVFVNVRGGGIHGQADAVVLGLARALVKANADYEPKLRAGNLLTRDARKVERKKYGQSGARKRFQYSKR
ncbi:MAG: 30S ribosomal protein S9 [Planctomycetota bacterium]